MLMQNSISTSIHQGILEKHIHHAFPGEDILANARKRASVKNPSTGCFFEVDVWIAKLQLGFEFQDPYHYATIWYSHKTLASIRSKDNLKDESIRKSGASLVLIPCWWNSKPESLFSLIEFLRPDIRIQQGSFSPVSLNPPTNYFEELQVQYTFDLMHPSFLSATNFYEQFSADHIWWLGEKYDGVRCFWKPNKRVLYSRRGLHISLPLAVYNQFPRGDLVLDGELWGGRSMHSDTFKIFGFVEDVVWIFLRMIVFDSVDWSKMPYEQRFDCLLSSVQFQTQFLIPAARFTLQTKEHLEESLQIIVGDRGEGVILQQAASIYEPGRSGSLLKIKSSREDSEGIVLSKLDHTFVIQLPNGITIEIGVENVAEDLIPTKGNIVTYNYDHLTKAGVPVNPRIARIRTDLFWEDVLRDYESNSLFAQEVQHPSKNIKMNELEREHKWRELFQQIARDRNLDPLVPGTWYSLSRGEIEKVKGAANVLVQYGGYSKALHRLFPELPLLNERKFVNLAKGYWADVGNRKLFFDAFAADNKFDPLVSMNWTSRVQQLTQRTKGLQMLDYYNGSFVKALLHLYPQIGLDKSSFFGTKTVRKFFDEFAREKGFDPLVAKNWYQVSTADIRKKETWSAALRSYSGNVTKALLSVYPNIGLEEAWFAHLPKNYWRETENRRKFFKTFAESKGFDPLVPDNWYSVSYEMVYSLKGGPSVLTYYNGNVKSALFHLFPNIGLDRFRFSILRNFWEDPKNKRDFFDRFAKERGFDSLIPSNWYPITLHEILATEKARTLISHYKNNLPRALMDVYPDLGFIQNQFLHAKQDRKIQTLS